MNVRSRQLQFVKEIARLKAAVRQSPLLDQSRKENSAGHLWHLAMYALLLPGYASGETDDNHVIRMLLLREIVEIDVGDFAINGGHAVPAMPALTKAQA